MNLNVVNLVGRVGSKEVKIFDSGKTLCKLTLAVRRSSKNDQPDWFNLELWGRNAEIAGDYVQVGGLIGVQGSLKIDTWNDRNTNAKRSKPMILVDRLELLGSKRDNDSNAAGNYSDNEF